MSDETKLLPKWINNNFFEKNFQLFYSDESVFVKSFEIVDFVNSRSRNYWNDIIKFIVNYTNDRNPLKSKNVTMKIENYNPHMDGGLSRFSTFKRELIFYRDILPKIEGLLVSKNDKETKICGKLVMLLDERPSPKCLVIEEFPHFKKVDRRVGLDLKHLKIVVAKLAKLHAASAVLYEDNEELFNHHQQPNITENFQIFHSLFENSLTFIINELMKKDGNEKLCSKLQNFRHFMFQRVSDASTLQLGELGVLCHGDLWMDNLVFEYKNDDDDDDDDVRGKVIDVEINEFGLSFFGSPAIDLTYLIFSSSSSDVRDFEIDVLLQHYHQHLHENLIKLNYPLLVPSLVHLHNSFLKCGVVGFVHSCLLLPMRFNISTDSTTETEIHSEFNLSARLEFLLKYFDRKGFLD